MNQCVFFASSLGFLAGVFLQSALLDVFVAPRDFVWLLLGTLVLIVLVIVWARLATAFTIFIAVFLLFNVLGVWHMSVNVGSEIAPADHLVGQTVTVRGAIVDDPDERENYTRLTIRTEKINDQDIDTYIIVSTSPYTSFKYRDRVEVTGKLRVPENFETDTGRIFDYVHYLWKDSVQYQMSFVEIKKIERQHMLRTHSAPSHTLPLSFVRTYASALKGYMLDLKNIFVRKIDQLYPQPEGALLAGVLFGEQAGLGTKLQDDFRETGVIHIVVLSGFNVTVVAVFIVWLLAQVMPNRIALFFGILSIILFVILVGAGATIVRAGAMAILAIIARLLGREAEVGRALILAAVIMVVHNPRILFFDISFQLSFLATMGVIYVAPPFERLLRFVPEALTLRETIVGTLSAQVFVSPLLLYAIGEFSIVSPLVNILIVPLVPLSMLLGFISALAAMVWAPLGTLFMLPTYVILNLQIRIVEFFGALPSASVLVPQFPVWMVVVSYALLLFAFVFRKSYNS